LQTQSWLVLIVRVPSEPARHRMALWRELRRAGALPLAQGVWALPDLPAIQPVLTRVRERVDTAEGAVLALTATGHQTPDTTRLAELYRAAREQEWTEFIADCGKYLAELDKEHRLGKYTLAELDEEEYSLERLRRWYRELRARDLLGTHASADADDHLKRCTNAFDDYADRVYAALGTPN
jgi:DNA-binding transcriptional regulator PaaX